MYVKKMIGYVLPDTDYRLIIGYDGKCVTQKGKNDVFIPITRQSVNWKHWVSQDDLSRCQACWNEHGKIYGVFEIPAISPPLHPNCRCSIEPMEAVKAGEATNERKYGADWFVKHIGRLPSYYLTIPQMRQLGWGNGKSPVKYAPGKMVGGGIYKNDDFHLPDALGRMWFEADLNYYSGKRNKHRLVWSNDGLIFVTYDHYESFIEVI